MPQVVIQRRVSLSRAVIGAMIGKQEGRNIEVMNSFELLSHTVDDRVHIDKEYYYTKEEQCQWFDFDGGDDKALFCLASVKRRNQSI